MSALDSKKSIICDLDGTIALDHHRAHHLHPPHKSTCVGNGPGGLRFEQSSCDCGWKRDWDTYFSLCGEDEPNWAVIDLLRLFWEDGYRIFIISGRSDKTLEMTCDWLRKNAVPHTALHLRPEDNHSQDNTLKLEVAKSLGLTPDKVIFCLEDRQRVVEAWRSSGYTCFQVAPGNF